MKALHRNLMFLINTSQSYQVKNKTANESYNERHEYLNGDQSVDIHSSWEVIDGSSIVIEVEDSFYGSNATSKNDEKQLQVLVSPQHYNEHESKKSSESLTATFASVKGTKQKREEFKKFEQFKKNNEIKQNKLFEYGENSEDEDYNSEEETKSRTKNYNSVAKTADTNTKPISINDYTEISRPKSKKNDSLNIRVESHSEQESEAGWIESVSQVPKSVRNLNNRQTNDSQSLKNFDSMSTHTSPHLKYTPKGNRNKGKHKNINQKEFRSFIENAKLKATNQVKNKSTNKHKNSKSPLKIVDKLVMDAHRRIRTKKQSEKLAQDAPFASTYKQWGKGLRNNSQQTSTRALKRYKSKSSLNSDSQVSAGNNSKASSTQRKMSQQRVKEMIKRFETQEQLKQEILQRERQIKKLENAEQDKELKNNIHDRYRKTKFKELYGTSRWERENSEELVRRLNQYAVKKQHNFEKDIIEKKQIEEKQLKTYFRPRVMKSQKSWENIKKIDNKIQQKRIKVELKREQNREYRLNTYEKRFELENKGTVYQRMQKDLEGRRERSRKRSLLKKIKDLNYKTY